MHQAMGGLWSRQEAGLMLGAGEIRPSGQTLNPELSYKVQGVSQSQETGAKPQNQSISQSRN